MMVVVMAVLMFLMIMLIVVVVIMIVILIVMMMLMMVVMCLFLLGFRRSLLNASDPTGRGSDPFKIEESGVDQIIQSHLGIVALDDLSGRLQSAEDLLDTSQLLRLHL